MNINTKSLILQLNTLAQSAEQLPSEQLSSALLDTCAYLLEMAAGNRRALSEMDAAERSELLDCYSLISEYVDSFAADARALIGLDHIRNMHEKSMANLQILRTEKIRLEDDLPKLRNDIENTMHNIGILQPQITAAEEKLANLNAIYADLRVREAACTPQIIDAQKAANRNLNAQVVQKEEELQLLQAKNATLSNNLASLTEAIRTVPQQTQALLEEYDQLETKLKRLQTAQVDCSYDRQKQLQDQIYELEPKATKLQEEYDKLKTIKDDLDAAYINYESQNHQFATDILEKIELHMDNLNRLLPQHLEYLQQIKNRSQQLQTTLREAMQLRDGYRAWFDQDITPLDAWINALGAPEFVNLHQKLDLLECKRVQMLKKRIEDALNELDQLIGVCSEAISQDQNLVEDQALGRRK